MQEFACILNRYQADVIKLCSQAFPYPVAGLHYLVTHRSRFELVVSFLLALDWRKTFYLTSIPFMPSLIPKCHHGIVPAWPFTKGDVRRERIRPV